MNNFRHPYQLVSMCDAYKDGQIKRKDFLVVRERILSQKRITVIAGGFSVWYQNKNKKHPNYQIMNNVASCALRTNEDLYICEV